MGNEKKVISLRLEEEFIEELKACAKEENRTISNLIETALIAYVKDKKERAR